MNQDPMIDNWASAYKTIFSSNGHVSQEGYRNRDAGVYHVINDNTVVAQFSYNMYDSPGYGFQQIKNYIYSVTYTYNAENDTLYADYSKEFEDAVNSLSLIHIWMCIRDRLDTGGESGDGRGFAAPAPAVQACACGFRAARRRAACPLAGTVPLPVRSHSSVYIICPQIENVNIKWR